VNTRKQKSGVSRARAKRLTSADDRGAGHVLPVLSRFAVRAELMADREQVGWGGRVRLRRVGKPAPGTEWLVNGSLFGSREETVIKSSSICGNSITRKRVGCCTRGKAGEAAIEMTVTR